MQRIVGDEYRSMLPYFKAAANIATQATCSRASCGSVIVKEGKIIGEGSNGPPLGNEENRRCEVAWDFSIKPKYDKTCCVHAEWRAVIDASKRNGADIEGSRLYFMRIDENGGFTDAGEPYCTVCSRLTMESGVSEFVLWNAEGADVYSLAEYDRKSADYLVGRTP